MHNLSDKEKEYVESAVKKGAENAVTIVDTRSGLKNGISIIQTNKLANFPLSIIFSEDVANKLIEIYVNNQDREIPFFLSGVIGDSGNGQGLGFKCSSIHIPNDAVSNQYDCEHSWEDAVTAVRQTLQMVKQGELGVVGIGHNHPVVECDRLNNRQIANNFSTQDIEGVEMALRHNIQLIEPQVMTMSLMVNHIGGINVIFVYNNRYFKLTDIKVKQGENIVDIASYVHPTLNKRMSVFEKPEDYDIPTDETLKIIEEITLERNTLER